jgi:quinoprotein glucose dehydrogenase
MSVSERRPRSRLANLIFALIILLLGAALLIGGVELIHLGGSWYYALTGAAFVIAAVLFARRSAWGAWLYAVALAWTLVWAVAISGIDFWHLLGRLAMPFIFGLWLLTPWARRYLVRGPRNPVAGRLMAGVLVGALVVVSAVGFVHGDRYETSVTQALPEVSDPIIQDPAGNWLHYGNDAGGTRFSGLSQITPENVNKLQVAWTYRTGDYPPPAGKNRRLEVTPLKVDDSLYLCSARSKLISLDAETGKERWSYDPKPDLTGVSASIACRGVAYFKTPVNEVKNPAAQCNERIIGATVDARLIAVDAHTGKPCDDFGDHGQINLKKDMGEVLPGYYMVTSAPQIARGNVVFGGWVSDGQSTGEPGGVIRAFNAITGQFAWAFDAGNPKVHTEPAAGETYVRGTPNSWAPISADEEMGLIYLPTGNATPDYYGGYRTALDDAYSSSVLALDATTGEERWTFQTTHHDLWDYDVASQPTLLDLSINGQKVPALIQPTKRGLLFVLDRRTGKPIFDVQEIPVPTEGGVPEERVSPTQPFTMDMPRFDGLSIPLDENNMWGMTPLDELFCRVRFKGARHDGAMTVPGLTPYVTMAGSLGGMDWGSISVDPERKLAIINWARMPMYNFLIPRKEADELGYHPDTGRGEDVGGGVAQAGTPYAASVSPFLSFLGAPCSAPPYGMITALDLNNKQIVWSKRLGNSYDSGPLGMKSYLPIPLGTPAFGGSLTTRSGVVFIAATQEQAFRALDLKTGKILWHTRLPAGGQATPMTYISPQSGDQFIVLASGGHTMLKSTPGDYIIGYKLAK